MKDKDLVDEDGTNIDVSVSLNGSESAKWDVDTWGPLADLAKDHPEAGVHFQGICWCHAGAMSEYVSE